LVGGTINGSGANTLELEETELVVLAAGVETTGVLAAGVELADVVAVFEVLVVDAAGLDVEVLVQDATGAGGFEMELLADAVKTGAGGAVGIELVELLEFAVELAEVAVLEEDALVGVGGATGGVGELDVDEGAGGVGVVLEALAAVGEGGGEVFSLLTVTVNCKSRSPS